jgi:hypothetical protein
MYIIEPHFGPLRCSISATAHRILGLAIKRRLAKQIDRSRRLTSCRFLTCFATIFLPQFSDLRCTPVSLPSSGIRRG